MRLGAAVIELSGTTWIDIGAVGLTSFIIFALIGPKLWGEFQSGRNPSGE